MKKRKKWYDKMHFYELTLLNDQCVNWWSELPLNEIKTQIGMQDFVTVTSGRRDYRKQEDMNTKVIRSVKEKTRIHRESYREHEEDFVKRIRIVRQIRKMTQPRKVRRVIKQWERAYRREIATGKWDPHEKECGIHIDVLMRFNAEYLETLLNQCKKIDLVS